MAFGMYWWCKGTSFFREKQLRAVENPQEGNCFPVRWSHILPMRATRRQKAENQKESTFVLFVPKSNVFFVFTNKHSFLSASSRKVFCTLICACLLILTKSPQNCRLFSARAHIACRNEHFFSPQGVTKMSASRRNPLFIPEEIFPKDGILAYFFPLVFLFETRKRLLPKKQKESRKTRWLTRPAPPCVRTLPAACTCQAKAVFRWQVAHVPARKTRVFSIACPSARKYAVFTGRV